MNFQLKASNNDRLAGFDRLFVNISWASLVRGELSVSELILEKPWVTLCADNQERLNLASAFPAPESQSPASKKNEKMVADSLYDPVGPDFQCIGWL